MVVMCAVAQFGDYLVNLHRYLLQRVGGVWAEFRLNSTLHARSRRSDECSRASMVLWKSGSSGLSAIASMPACVSALRARPLRGAVMFEFYGAERDGVMRRVPLAEKRIFVFHVGASC